MKNEYYIGLMSGTSADGVDAVVATFSDPVATVHICGHSYIPYNESLRARIIALMTPGPNEIERCGAIEGELAELFAQAAINACEAAYLPRNAIRAIGSHGQTLRHRPTLQPAFTLQIGDPARIVERTGITTVADFRRRDIAAGGQGAPLVPAFHQWLFSNPHTTRAIVNIGGIANATILPAHNTQSIVGFDTGPGNALLDAWIKKTTGANQDTGGKIAAQGHLCSPLLTLLQKDPYFALPPPKSTGREHFTLSWLEEHLSKLDTTPNPIDTQATLTYLTASSIIDALKPFDVDEIFLCGGGTENPILMRNIRQLFGKPVATTSMLGLAPNLVEPTAFAWLAFQTMQGRPGNAPSATGASHAAILGAIYLA